MGMTNDGLSYWQAESEGIDLLETTIGDLLDRRAEELPTQEAVVYSCYPGMIHGFLQMGGLVADARAALAEIAHAVSFS